MKEKKHKFPLGMTTGEEAAKQLAFGFHLVSCAGDWERLKNQLLDRGAHPSKPFRCDDSEGPQGGPQGLLYRVLIGESACEMGGVLKFGICDDSRN
jgi:hypothetical protein